MKKRKDMKKKAERIKWVTTSLTWCDSARGEAVKSEGGEGGEKKKGVKWGI